MGTPCERCKRRDEQDYRNLDDEQKYFLMLMIGDFRHEMTIPEEFVQRFKYDIPGEIKLETRNGYSYTVVVTKYQEKLVLAEGWGQFVKTYDLQMGDYMIFRYKGNSQFNVIIFDQLGREKALSVVVDATLHPHAQERRSDATETVKRSHAHPQPMPKQPPTETVNHSHAHPRALPMQSPTETAKRSHAHSRPMQMQSPITERQPRLQRGISSQGNRTMMSSSSSESSGDSLASDDTDRNHELHAVPDYIVARKTKLTAAQEKLVKNKVQTIYSEIPFFVAVMGKTNVTSGFILTVPKRYAGSYLGNEKSICLRHLGDKWNVKLGGGSFPRIVGGWQKFVLENEVKMGDICLFQLLKNHNRCMMEVYIIRAE